MNTSTMILLSSILGFATSLGAGAQNGSASASASAGAQASRATTQYLTTVQTELTSKVDTKNAVVGQEITATTKQDAKLADGTMLPQGTKLVGRVTEVQARTKEQTNSRLTMTFDRAELKGGQTLRLRSMIRTLAPPVHATAGDDRTAMDSMGPAAAPTGAAAGTRGGMGGGGLGSDGLGSGGLGAGAPAGGGGRSTGRTTGQTTGTALGAATIDPSAIAGSAGQTGGSATALAGETVGSGARATALPGVMVSNSTSANVSGTLTAFGKNISLDSGTQMTLGVIAQ